MTAADPSNRAARLHVDLDAVASNYESLSTLAPTSAMAAVVKADAYGLGASDVAKHLTKNGCAHFFTATAQEGADLREAVGAGATIWVLNGFEARQIERFAKARLSPVISTPDQAAAFSASALPNPFAIHIDTGMNRLGLAMGAIADMALNGRSPALVMSHLACSEDANHPMNAAQLDRFLAVSARFPDANRSLSNTGGVFLGTDYHFDLCRPGIGLYGATALPGQDHGLTPAARLEAPILQLRELQPGEAVGYGASFTADRPLLAATIAAGYADGLPRSLSNTGWGRLGESKAPILGRISMDLTVLDVTPVKAAAQIGETVSFFGADLDALADAAGTLPYELLTGIGGRVERVMG